VANEVEIVVKATDKTADGVASVDKNFKGLGRGIDELAGKQRKGGKDSLDYGERLGAAGERADTAEQRIIGVKDTISGVSSIMQGPGAQGIDAYLQGWADLASGVFLAVVPALQAFSLANAKATASAVAGKAAAIAAGTASKVWAAGQWLLNVALTANPIGVVVMAIAALVGAIILAYKNSETFRKIVDAAMKGVQKSIGWLVDKAVAGFKRLWESIKEVWGWFRKLTGGSEESADATDDAAESSRDAATAYQDQSDALDELTDRLLGVRDGEAGLEAAIDDATKALKENGRTTDVHTEKGRANRKALDEIVRSTLSYRQSLKETGASQAQQTAATERGRAALIRAGVAMGMTKAQARAYADQILHIPASRSTRVSLRTPNLGAVRRSFDVVLRDRVVNVRVITTSSRRISDQDKRTGGISGAASGGARGSTTLVGEDGPEIVELPFGSMVRSNPDSMRMLAAGGGGGGGPIVIDLRIGDRALGRLLIDPLRREIRTQGGDVQAVLGAG